MAQAHDSKLPQITLESSVIKQGTLGLLSQGWACPGEGTAVRVVILFLTPGQS